MRRSIVRLHPPFQWERIAGGSFVEGIPLPLGREQRDRFFYLCDLLSGFLLQHLYQCYFLCPLVQHLRQGGGAACFTPEKAPMTLGLHTFLASLMRVFLGNNNLLN